MLRRYNLKMKKQLIISLMAVLLICVGLSGCNESDRNNVVSIREIRQHPNNFINENVTVKAFSNGFTDSRCLLTEDETGELLSNIRAKVCAEVDTSMVVTMGYYYWKGIVRYDNNYWDTNFDNSELYIEISEIQPVYN